jgi:hypothetical protein
MHKQFLISTNILLLKNQICFTWMTWLRFCPPFGIRFEVRFEVRFDVRFEAWKRLCPPFEEAGKRWSVGVGIAS